LPVAGGANRVVASQPSPAAKVSDASQSDIDFMISSVLFL
jgi:hypothetical protein